MLIWSRQKVPLFDAGTSVEMRPIVRSAGGLKRHEVQHIVENRFVCDHCGKSYATKCGHRQHIRMNHADLESSESSTGNHRLHKCSKCDQSFASLRDMKRHQREHKVEKPLACDQCSRSFLKLTELNSHILQVHDGLTPSKQPIGNVLSSEKVNELDVERRFVCGQCNASFTKMADLCGHSREIHASLKPSESPEIESEHLHIVMISRHEKSKECGLKLVPVVRLQRVDFPLCSMVTGDAFRKELVADT
jgi:uncharacterized Zn-finger protein